jgi:hypothetical protein
MGALRQNFVMAVALAGGLCASQAPEFAQQYRQRIGGAIEELSRVVADFDRDAANNGLTRDQALDMHVRAEEPLFRDRGKSMQTAIDRLETLNRQRADFATRSPLVQPLVLAYSDPVTLDGTWRDFRPGVPVTAAGFSWAGAGFFTAVLVLYVILRILSAVWRLAFSARPAPDRPRLKP